MKQIEVEVIFTWYLRANSAETNVCFYIIIASRAYFGQI